METSISLVVAVACVLLAFGFAAFVGYRIADRMDKKHGTEIKHH